MRSAVSVTFNKSSLNQFNAACSAMIQNVHKGSKRATTEACKEILAESLKQVPRETDTLADSAFYEVERRTDVKGYVYKGTVGYGGNGDPINPKTGMPASSYMVVVHEDLMANHPVGKAKYLEDPVRAYSDEKFARGIVEILKDALAPFLGR